MIRLLLNGKMNEAGDILFANNPLSIVCSLVCNHENQCEGHCIQKIKGSAIHISSIENYISDTCFDKLELKKEEKKGIKAAIIGSGPAGITVAIRLAQKGYDVTLFESRDRIGGVLRYGIPEFRLPKSILDRYEEKMVQLGIQIRPNTTIGGALTIDDLFRDDYKAVFIGTGVWRSKTLGIKGESLGNVHFAIDYLINPDVYHLGDHVAIIGAGNSAMDVARTALRKNCRFVTIYARGNTIAASQREQDYAKADGVEFRNGMMPEEIREAGPVFREAVFDEDGNVLSYKQPELCPADTTIIAVSQGPKDKIVNTTEGIATTKSGLVWTDAEGKTTHEGIFASGDVVRGAKTVVEAMRYSKKVAESMDAYMSGPVKK